MKKVFRLFPVILGISLLVACSAPPQVNRGQTRRRNAKVPAQIPFVTLVTPTPGILP